MRKALIIGINYYHYISNLSGCINDAKEVLRVLSRNGNGTKNFDCRTILVDSEDLAITRKELKIMIEDLFNSKEDVVVLYFAGHGYVESSGGYIITSDCEDGDDGVSLDEIVGFANASPATNRIIILDSCHSGAAGSGFAGVQELAGIKEGVTILTASAAEQYSEERDGRGVYTSLLVDALDGSAADLVGNISPGSVYAHIDQALGEWEQRPIFKTNVRSFISLRRVTPPIELNQLHMITELFPCEAYEFTLNPTYEPEMRGRQSGDPDPIEENAEKFALLQKYNRLNLLVPIRAPHMWHAAMNSEACKLTELGRHYWRLVKSGQL